MAHSTHDILQRLGVTPPYHSVAIGGKSRTGGGDKITDRSPINGDLLAEFAAAQPADASEAVDAAQQAFRMWRIVPAPQRGELVRQMAGALREHQEELAILIAWEVGKTMQEARGEVQEMIDVADFAVGLSRQLYGRTIASERPGHRLMEQWLPLGPIGVITAFNFPVAVWAWNAMLALVCGDPVLWKPSEKAPLCALACHAIAMQVCENFSDAPEGLLSLLVGLADVGESLAANKGLPLISATGSVPMGKAVAQVVAARLGRTLLELGGNNGMIVAPSADRELALRSIVFSAAGTCGQRCTTLRRLIVHESIAEELIAKLKSVYGKLSIGNPLEEKVLVGPLIDEQAFQSMQSALKTAQKQGGKVTLGEQVTQHLPEGGWYVRPAIVEIEASAPIVREETFAPILYVMRYQNLEEAIAVHNNVPQGLSSSILTTDMREAELFCSAAGSDCGIANVNAGPSGAEIGGAFGGEKETGGGRESGSDSWKAYMRRATNTINYSSQLPLAQGVRFEID